MADTTYSIPTYPGVYPVNHGGDNRGDHGLAAFSLLGNLHDASRDIAAANTANLSNLTAAGASAGRDVDIMSAVREEGGDGRDTTRDAAHQVTDGVSNGFQHLTHEVSNGFQHLGHGMSSGFQHVNDNLFVGIKNIAENVLREGASMREELAQQGKENAILTLEQASKGRETTQAVGAQIREDIGDAHTQNLLAHCETQKLVIKEHCETREAVREEGVRTRDLIVAESRACLERELAAAKEEATLLKIQLNLLSSGNGNGPLLRS